jgi:hypothetical protein
VVSSDVRQMKNEGSEQELMKPSSWRQSLRQENQARGACFKP